ncbi:hypothetical protein THAOC_09014, partial [Thalassiosira oceanica]
MSLLPLLTRPAMPQGSKLRRTTATERAGGRLGIYPNGGVLGDRGVAGAAASTVMTEPDLPGRVVTSSLSSHASHTPSRVGWDGALLSDRGVKASEECISERKDRPSGAAAEAWARDPRGTGGRRIPPRRRRLVGRSDASICRLAVHGAALRSAARAETEHARNEPRDSGSSGDRGEGGGPRRTKSDARPGRRMRLWTTQTDADRGLGGPRVFEGGACGKWTPSSPRPPPSDGPGVARRRSRVTDATINGSEQCGDGLWTFGGMERVQARAAVRLPRGKTTGSGGAWTGGLLWEKPQEPQGAEGGGRGARGDGGRGEGGRRDGGEEAGGDHLIDVPPSETPPKRPLSRTFGGGTPCLLDSIEHRGWYRLGEGGGPEGGGGNRMGRERTLGRRAASVESATSGEISRSACRGGVPKDP